VNEEIVSCISYFSSSLLAFLYYVLYPFKVFSILANFSIFSLSDESFDSDIWELVWVGVWLISFVI
jgi:hypothetical protein